MSEVKKKLRAAIIGSGPAGFYCADRIFRNTPAATVHMFDKLPTPHGLVRQGVAPDHQKTKTVSKAYDRIASVPGFRFFGLVDFGKDITLADLKKRYHQIVFATGAQTDRKMDIPGEHLPGSHTATEFVAWYNGHPHFSDLSFDMSCERAVIIGAGNVALDVARILCLSREELVKTDMANYAIEKLSRSNVREVFIIARRGPAQAAFTNLELKELANLEDTNTVTTAREMELDAVTKKALKNHPDRSAGKKLEILSGFSSAGNAKSKTLHIRFFLSPLLIEAGENGRVSKVTFVKNRLVKKTDGTIGAVATDETETMDTGLVFRSIGYMGVALKDVPFDPHAGLIPNNGGRVLSEPGGETLAGMYAAGWIKRGATGVIGTNKTDSSETVDHMIEDFTAGVSFEPEIPANSIEKLLEERKPGYVNYGQWLLVDKKETELGQKTGRPRVKHTTIEQIMETIKKS